MCIQLQPKEGTMKLQILSLWGDAAILQIFPPPPGFPQQEYKYFAVKSINAAYT